MKIFLKSIVIILIFFFWFYSTYLYGVGAHLFIKAERYQDVNVYKKFLLGPYPLKSEIRLNYFGKFWGAVAKGVPFSFEMANFALSLVEKEVKDHPRSLFALMSLAEGYTVLGLPDEARGIFWRLLQLSPERQTSKEMVRVLNNFLNNNVK